MFYGAKSGCGTYSMNILLSKGGPPNPPVEGYSKVKVLAFFPYLYLLLTQFCRETSS